MVLADASNSAQKTALTLALQTNNGTPNFPTVQLPYRSR